MIRAPAEATMRMLAFEYPFAYSSALRGGKVFGACVQKIEGREDEESEGHTRGICGCVLGWEESAETACPVFDVLWDIEVRFF